MSKEIVNESGYKPTMFRVLIKVDDAEKKTAGGIILPDEIVSNNQFAKSEGILIDHGYCAFVDGKDKEWPEKPELGSRVAFKAYGGINVEGKDGNSYRVLNDEEIFAVIN